MEINLNLMNIIFYFYTVINNNFQGCCKIYGHRSDTLPKSMSLCDVKNIGISKNGIKLIIVTSDIGGF